MTNRKDAKDVKKNGGGDQDFAVWKADLEFFLEMNSDHCRRILKWADETKVEDITDQEFKDWAQVRHKL